MFKIKSTKNPSQNQEEFSLNHDSNKDDIYYVKTEDVVKLKKITQQSNFNQKFVKEYASKYPLTNYPTQITELENKEDIQKTILESYKNYTLKKGQKETLQAICWNLSIKNVYVVGFTDQVNELRFHSALKVRGSELKVQRIPISEAELVYKTLQYEPNLETSTNAKIPHKRKIPRRHFFCRFFAF